MMDGIVYLILQALQRICNLANQYLQNTDAGKIQGVGNREMLSQSRLNK